MQKKKSSKTVKLVAKAVKKAPKPLKQVSKTAKQASNPKAVATAEYLLREKRYRDFITETEGQRPRVDDPRASEKTRTSLRD